MDEGVNPHLKLNEILETTKYQVKILNEVEKWLIFEKS